MRNLRLVAILEWLLDWPDAALRPQKSHFLDIDFSKVEIRNIISLISYKG